MGKRGHLPPPLLEMLCFNFLCISSYSKTLGRRIVFALFYTNCRWLLRASPLDPMHRGSIHGLRWDFCPQHPNLPTPGRNPADAYETS